MPKTVRTFRLPFSSFLLFGLLTCASAFAQGNDCYECHQGALDSSRARSLHPPYTEGECDSCHEDHGDNNTLTLTERGNELCVGCHEFGRGDFVKSHGGITGTRALCRGCHNPHYSSRQRLLRSDLHRPVSEGKCQSCHRKDGRLLLPRIDMLCQMCHPRKDFLGTSTHQPVKEGRCLKCHDPHGSAESSLLTSPYSEERFLTKGEKDYALCIDCHETAPLIESGSKSETGFSNKAVNLHWLHISEKESSSSATSRSSGINCHNCHDPHSAQEEHLIRRELDCGGVLCLKLSYRITSSGGECQSGCHGLKSYSRSAGQSDRQNSVIRPSTVGGSDAGASGGVPIACRTCHESEGPEFTRKVRHLPVERGDCESCHLDHGSENRLVLTEDVEKLCGKCHDLSAPAITEAHGGLTIRGSRCTACHTPHSSSEKNLLNPIEHDPYADRDCPSCHGDGNQNWKLDGPMADLCGECHDSVLDYANLHPAMDRVSCIGCHEPHSSDLKGLLNGSNPELCYRCHPPEKYKKENSHHPVSEGKCTECHPPHASDIDGLLVGTYPLQRFVPWRKEAYTLCWRCHDPLVFADPSADSTGFRTADKNLHFIHVQDTKSVVNGKEKTSPGISCRNCHDPHSTDYPKLIIKTLDCEGVRCLEIIYKKMGSYGTCSKGCHASRSYGQH